MSGSVVLGVPDELFEAVDIQTMVFGNMSPDCAMDGLPVIILLIDPPLHEATRLRSASATAPVSTT